MYLKGNMASRFGMSHHVKRYPMEGIHVVTVTHIPADPELAATNWVCGGKLQP